MHDRKCVRMRRSCKTPHIFLVRRNNFVRVITVNTVIGLILKEEVRSETVHANNYGSQLAANEFF